MAEFDNTEFYDFLGALTVAKTLDDYESIVAPFCSQAFTVQSVLAIKFDRDSAPEIIFRWIPDEKLRTTFDRYYDKLGYMLDPFYQLALETPDWVASPLRKIAPDRFETSEYFSNYFRTTEMVDELGFVARILDDSAIHLSIGRNSGQKRFRSNEIAKFKLLARVLAPKLKSLIHDHDFNPSVSVPKLENRYCDLSKLHGEEISFREAEVAALIVQGHSSRAIGLKLGISGHTVKVHRRNIYKKLQISSQNELFGLLIKYVDGL